MNEATVRTEHDHPEVVAAAIVPDNTTEMATDVEDGVVVTHIERETIGGLRATITDYLRGISVADETARLVTAEDDDQP